METYDPNPPGSPNIRVSGLSIDDANAASILSVNLSQLRNFAEHYLTAVYLFDVTLATLSQGGFSLPVAIQLQMGAGRLGIIALYNYRAVIRGIDSEVRRQRSFFNNADLKLLKASSDKFDEIFPYSSELRQSILHGGDQHSNYDRTVTNRSYSGKTVKGPTPESRKQSAPKKGEPLTGMVATGPVIINRMYSTCHKGDFYSYELTYENVRSLNEITKSLYSVFSGYYDE